MGRGRLEAFSDGVIAIILTIMVLNLKTPTDPTLEGLAKVSPHFLSYLLSFLVIAILWVNHHRMMSKVTSVSNWLLWTNNLLLFAMSLIPFATAYMGEHHRDPFPVACYGVVMVLSGLAFTLCRFAAVSRYPDPSTAKAVHIKDLTASTMYALSIPLAFVSVRISFIIFGTVAVAYFLAGFKHDVEQPG